MEKQKILSFGLTAILIVSIIFISGCISQPTEKPPEAPPEKPAVEQPASPTCPTSCDDGNVCTRDYCSLDTNYECRNDPLTPCCGNDICESNENYESCPKDCAKEAEVEISYTDVTPAKAKEMMEESPDLIIIDVSPNYSQGHIPNAVNYNIRDGSLDSAIPNLDKKGKYLVYCQSEGASIEGAENLIDAGFEKVYRLEGNYAAWLAAGYEIEKPPSVEIEEERVAAGVITVDELSMHNNRHNCWVSYEGNVYDITNWVASMTVYPRCGTSIYAFDRRASPQYDPMQIPEQGVLKGTFETST